MRSYGVIRLFLAGCWRDVFLHVGIVWITLGITVENGGANRFLWRNVPICGGLTTGTAEWCRGVSWDVGELWISRGQVAVFPPSAGLIVRFVTVFPT